MTVAIAVVERTILKQMVKECPYIKMDENDLRALDACLLVSNTVLVGLVNDQYACCWGLVPPTMMSNRAYLWLHTSSLIDEHKFLFVRHSQRWMERVLEDYSEIVGFCKPENTAAIRWIEWLGGQFKRPFGPRADFVIRRKEMKEALCG